MGIGKNTVRRVIATKMIFPDIKGLLASSADIDAGDLVVFNDTTNKIEKPAAEADASTFVGVMPISVRSGKMVGPYTGLTDVDAAVAAGAMLGPQYGDVHACILKSGDTLAAGDRVYLDPTVGPRVVAAAGTKSIGVYQGNAAVTGDGTLEIEVLFGSRFPNDTLKF